MNLRSGGARDPGVLLVPPSTTIPGVLDQHPALPAVVLACSDRLPRDVLLRLAGLARQVTEIRQDHVADAELSLRLDELAAGVGAAIQSIYDDTAQHFVGRRV